ncbi:MAG: sigma-70 family RNA polymerase sigma factor [Verrucomicrobia bacterium]|nr:sigma-70 family RNA polymerase sigma factor [Verrucomicrobiota bacterium]
MASDDHGRADVGAGAAAFATTHWSVVLAAEEAHAPQAAAALEQLCRTYWYPLYAYVRRQGHSPADAQDLTQDFFAHLLARDFPRGATPERGKFRSFLLAALRHFLVDRHRHDAAAKRGGSQRTVSLDDSRAEERFRLEPQHELTPEKLYEREWARTLLERAQARLREEYVAAGKSELFERLRAFPLAERSSCTFEQAARELDLTGSALKSAAHRLRARYRQLVREEVVHTVADPTELNEEARHLIAVIGG